MINDRAISNQKWVDDFITKLEEVSDSGGKVIVRDPNTGHDITVAIRNDLLIFLITNRFRLAQVSYNAFKNFLGLLEKQKDFEALVTIYQELDISDLLDKYKEDSIKLAQLALQTQADRLFWVEFIKQAAEKIVFSALGVIVQGIIV